MDGKQAMENLKNMKVPKGTGAGAALTSGAVLMGGAAYGLYHSLFNGKHSPTCLTTGQLTSLYSTSWTSCDCV